MGDFKLIQNYLKVGCEKANETRKKSFSKSGLKRGVKSGPDCFILAHNSIIGT